LRLTEKEVHQYLAEGWRFRTKNVGSRKYISRRKEQKEVGLGRFDEGYWEMIEATKEEYIREMEEEERQLIRQKYERKRKAKLHESFIFLNNRWRTTRMAETCVHAPEGYCLRWIYRHGDSYYESIRMMAAGSGLSFLEETDDMGVMVLYFKAGLDFCENCSGFESKRV
jgi:hypothetical protein